MYEMAGLLATECHKQRRLDIATREWEAARVLHGKSHTPRLESVCTALAGRASEHGKPDKAAELSTIADILAAPGTP